MKSVEMKMNDQGGFTLVELMVVGAILSVLMLALTGYLFQQARQTRINEARQNMSQMQGVVLEAASQMDSASQTEALKFEDLD